MVQTYQNWELLIQDDCSTDNTKEVVEKFIEETPGLREKIKYECNTKNSGAAITRNNALKRAQGRWIAFLDSDDLWLPEKLEKQLRFMAENGYKFSYTAYKEMDNESRETGVVIRGPKHVSKLGMFAFCWPGCLTVMYDREAVGLVQIADIKKNNDYAMWLKVCRKADCYLLNEVLAKYRRGRVGSVSTHGYSTMIIKQMAIRLEAYFQPHSIVVVLLNVSNLHQSHCLTVVHHSQAPRPTESEHTQFLHMLWPMNLNPRLTAVVIHFPIGSI